MSQDRARRVGTLIELWSTRDFTRVPEFFDPGVELESPFSSVAGAPYRGYAGIERWIADIDQQFAEWSVAPQELRDAGDRVIAIAAIGARGRGSEVRLQFPAATVFEFAADNRVTRMRIYLDLREALADIGLEE
jgi:SnoaL-like domain